MDTSKNTADQLTTWEQAQVKRIYCIIQSWRQKQASEEKPTTVVTLAIVCRLGQMLLKVRETDFFPWIWMLVM